MAGVADWPAWATARVQVRPADPQWQRRGEVLRHELDLTLARWLMAPVEHVGSTAVPGLAAKPVLDLQAAVANLGCAPAVAEVLAGSGWHLVPPELDARPWRRFLVQVGDGMRVAHLHLLTANSKRWGEQLAFRDALRNDPGLRSGTPRSSSSWRSSTPTTERRTPRPRPTSSASRWARVRSSPRAVPQQERQLGRRAAPKRSGLTRRVRQLQAAGRRPPRRRLRTRRWVRTQGTRRTDGDRRPLRGRSL